MKKYLYMSTTFLVLGLLSGIFYREFTKFAGFEGSTVLSAVHSHLLILGFIFGLILLLFEKTLVFQSKKVQKLGL